MAPDEYDFLENQLEAEDKAYLEGISKARQRQQAVREGMSVPPMTEKEADEARKAEEILHRKITMAQAGLDEKGNPLPGITPGVVPGPAPAPSGPSFLDVWYTVVNGETFYAPNWKTLKEKIRDHNGMYEAAHHRFAATCENVLGFFVSAQGWDPPAESLVESFAVMIRDGAVFKSDAD